MRVEGWGLAVQGSGFRVQGGAVPPRGGEGQLRYVEARQRAVHVCVVSVDGEGARVEARCRGGLAPLLLQCRTLDLGCRV